MEKKLYEIVVETKGGKTMWFAREKGGHFVGGTMTCLGAMACKMMLTEIVNKTENVVEEVEL
jgi:hypothetical protein